MCFTYAWATGTFISYYFYFSKNDKFIFQKILKSARKKKAGEREVTEDSIVHEALVKSTRKLKRIHIQWPLKLRYQAPHLEVQYSSSLFPFLHSRSAFIHPKLQSYLQWAMYPSITHDLHEASAELLFSSISSSLILQIWAQYSHDSCFRWKLFLERRRELNKEVNWEYRETASAVWKLQGREFLQHYPTHVFIIAEVPTAQG